MSNEGKFSLMMTSLTSPKFKGALKAQRIQFFPSSEETLGKASGFRAKLHQSFRGWPARSRETTSERCAGPR